MPMVTGSRGVAHTACFICTMCDAPHRLLRDAEACCRCQTCGEKFPRESYGSDCGHCLYGYQLREARKTVRREEEGLADAKRRLADLLATKRPPKGSKVI